MLKICRFCKIQFKDVEGEKVVCGDCKKIINDILETENPKQELLNLLISDPDIKFDFLDSILADEKVVKRIAKSVFNEKATEVGLGGPGTIAQFFSQ